MTLIESLIHGKMLLALGLFAVVSVLVEVIGYKLLATVAEVDATHWTMKHTVVPAARALALVIFIIMAYPVLFGVEFALPISELLAMEKMRLINLVNVIFLLSLLLPMIPIFSRWPALVLPIQGIAASTMVFRWWAATQPATDIHYWPGWATIGGLFTLAFFTHEIAKWLSHHLEKQLDAALHRQGTGLLIYRTVVMIMQVPVILVYTLSLGKQLH